MVRPPSRWRPPTVRLSGRVSQILRLLALPFVCGLAFWAGAAVPASAQAVGDISGRVTYAATGQGVADVLVAISTLNLGWITDDEGRFALKGVAEGRHEIITAMAGCWLGSRFVDVRADELVEVALDLAPPVVNLGGFVITALADESIEVEPPFAVGSFDPQQEASAASRTLAGLLRGRVAGARVVQGSGQPGDAASILLRGPTSIQTGQGPLVVVDGVVTQGTLPPIDPLDVEHVEVLRGAVAAAHYGARGQAGVIEITTRRGPAPELPADGPLVIIDGAPDRRSLGDIAPGDIGNVRVFEGPGAALLYGPRAAAGVIHVTTVGAGLEASRPPFCVDLSG